MKLPEMKSILKTKRKGCVLRTEDRGKEEGQSSSPGDGKQQGSALPWSLAQLPQLFARKELGVGKEAESFKLTLGNMTDPCAREHLWFMRRSSII